MNTWARKSFKVGVLSAGVLLFAGTAANADFNSAGNSGFLSGNQINSAIQAPIDVCGNAIGIVGNTSAACVGGSWANLGQDGTPRFNSFGNSGIGSGNQINATVQAPIDVCGNAVGVFGNAHAACVGGSSAKIGSDRKHGDRKHGDRKHGKSDHYMTAPHVRGGTESAHITESAHTTEAGGLNSFGNSGVGSGNQVNAGLQLPIDVCGNAIGVVGNALASCVGGSTASNNSGGGAPTLNSGFNSGILSGNQINALLQIPVNVCGNAIGLFGNSKASCVGGSAASANGGNGGGDNGGGNGGGGNNGGGDNGGGSGGNSFMAAMMGGNGMFTEGASYDHGRPNRHPHADGGACSPTLNSFGNAGFLSGNQANLVTQAPVEISGNAISLVGNSQAWSIGGAFANC